MSSDRVVVYALPSSPTETIARRALDALPANQGRSSRVHSLVKAFELIRHPQSSDEPDRGVKARLLQTGLASREALCAFHDRRFVDSMLIDDPHAPSLPPSPSSEDSSDASDESTNGDFGLSDDPYAPPTKRRKVEEFGLHHDCPRFALLPTYARLVAGASIAAAQELREGRADVAIAWDGGRHHAQRVKAKGFCYVNDIVLAILELRKRPTTPGVKKVDRVAYVDLDVHHGDGVEAAFLDTPRVLTISLHLHNPTAGFFPLSGALSTPGSRSAPSHALNLAMLPNLSSDSLLTLIDSAVLPLLQAYDPAAVVVQCGVDGLQGDPSSRGRDGWGWGLGLEGFGRAVEKVLQEGAGSKRKVLLLGGGGYSSAAAARAWTYLTSIALGRPLPIDSPIPQDEGHHPEYAPSFTLDVPGMRSVNLDENGSLDNGRLKQVVDAMRGHAEVLRQRYAKKPV